jgi:hypothetical protein
MFTDESDSDIEHQNMLNYPDKTPIYIVHDTNLLSQYHDALTLTVIRSGGAIFSDPEDAFELIALKQNAQNSQGSVLSVDRYGSWMLSEGSVNLTGNNDDLIAHKQAINQMIKSGSSELEQIHQIAITHGLVSPYSSYIALVTDRQKQQLENESKKDDKFDADYDVGEESISDPSMSGALNLGAVPEPEEWALIISAVILLGYFYRRELSRLVFQKR